jgi:hypothetical protein
MSTAPAGAPSWVWLADDDDTLARHAATLYPDDVYLQQQWVRGVRLVRTTARGWLLDPPHWRAPSRHATLHEEPTP